MNFMVIAIAGVVGTIAIALVQEKNAYYKNTEELVEAESISKTV